MRQFRDMSVRQKLTVIILLMPKPVSAEHVIGILSLIVWTLILLVTIQYAWLAMGLSRRGEGGTIVLREILAPLLKSGRQAAFVTLPFDDPTTPDRMRALDRWLGTRPIFTLVGVAIGLGAGFYVFIVRVTAESRQGDGPKKPDP